MAFPPYYRTTTHYRVTMGFRRFVDYWRHHNEHHLDLYFRRTNYHRFANRVDINGN